jgi:hypothetical protein
LVKRVTGKEPPAGALLASKKNKVKPVTKVQKVKKAAKQRSTHGVSMGESPSLNIILIALFCMICKLFKYSSFARNRIEKQ